MAAHVTIEEHYAIAKQQLHCNRRTVLSAQSVLIGRKNDANRQSRTSVSHSDLPSM
jgi:hypothetical protein